MGQCSVGGRLCHCKGEGQKRGQGANLAQSLEKTPSKVYFPGLVSTRASCNKECVVLQRWILPVLPDVEDWGRRAVVEMQCGYESRNQVDRAKRKSWIFFCFVLEFFSFPYDLLDGSVCRFAGALMNLNLYLYQCHVARVAHWCPIVCHCRTAGSPKNNNS